MQSKMVLVGAVTGQFERPGADLYSGYCAKCHGDNGTAKPPKIPRLGGNKMVLSEKVSSPVRLVFAWLDRSPPSLFWGGWNE
jgi:hypothetical protein